MTILSAYTFWDIQSLLHKYEWQLICDVSLRIIRYFWSHDTSLMISTTCFGTTCTVTPTPFCMNTLVSTCYALLQAHPSFLKIFHTTLSTYLMFNTHIIHEFAWISTLHHKQPKESNTHQSWKFHQMAVKFACLNGVLDEEIYEDQPQGFLSLEEEQKVCRLNEALYGLKQAHRTWHTSITFVKEG